MVDKEDIKNEVRKRKLAHQRRVKFQDILNGSKYNLSSFGTIVHNRGLFSTGHHAAYVSSRFYDDNWCIVILPDPNKNEDEFEHISELEKLFEKAEEEMGISITMDIPSTE